MASDLGKDGALGEIRTPNRLIRRCIITVSSVVIQSHGVAFALVNDSATKND